MPMVNEDSGASAAGDLDVAAIAFVLSSETAARKVEVALLQRIVTLGRDAATRIITKGSKPSVAMPADTEYMAVDEQFAADYARLTSSNSLYDKLAEVLEWGNPDDGKGFGRFKGRL